MIHHFRITRFLPYQSSRSNVFRSILPNSIGFIIPYSTDCLTDEPTIGGIILLYTILVIIIVDMVNFILINRKSYGSIPCKIPILNICRIQSDFKALVLYFTQIGHDGTETRKTRQTLAHYHVCCFLQIIIHVSSKSSIQK